MTHHWPTSLTLFSIRAHNQSSFGRTPTDNVMICTRCLCRVRWSQGPNGGQVLHYLPKDVAGWENASRRTGECK